MTNFQALMLAARINRQHVPGLVQVWANGHEDDRSATVTLRHSGGPEHEIAKYPSLNDHQLQKALAKFVRTAEIDWRLADE